MPITPEQQKKITTLLDQHAVAVAYLFGSQSRGTTGRTSDTDIALLFKTEPSLQQQLRREGLLLQELHRILGTEIDLINLQVASSPLLKHRAVLRGKLLYCSDNQQRQKLEKKVFHEYEDTEFLRALHGQTLLRHSKDGSFGVI